MNTTDKPLPGASVPGATIATLGLQWPYLFGAMTLRAWAAALNWPFQMLQGPMLQGPMLQGLDAKRNAEASRRAMDSWLETMAMAYAGMIPVRPERSAEAQTATEAQVAEASAEAQTATEAQVAEASAAEAASAAAATGADVLQALAVGGMADREADQLASHSAHADTAPGASLRPAGLDAPRAGKADDLTLIVGIGPKMQALLNGLGFFHFDQIAAWTEAEIVWVDERLEGFKGRVTRDRWGDQARQLAVGRTA